MARYSAKLMFQFRIDRNGDSGKRRKCEERIVVLQASSAVVALRKANRLGAKSETSYPNSDSNTVHCEFVGVMDLLHLGIECEADEVWYEIRERVLPMERREQFIPEEADLCAIYLEQ